MSTQQVGIELKINSVTYQLLNISAGYEMKTKWLVLIKHLN
jgi:hypothetical protein